VVSILVLHDFGLPFQNPIWTRLVVVPISLAAVWGMRGGESRGSGGHVPESYSCHFILLSPEGRCAALYWLRSSSAVELMSSFGSMVVLVPGPVPGPI
jgi:hypothetical protein